MLTTGLLFLGRTPLLPNSRIDDSLKIYFQSGVNRDLAIAQIVAATNAIRALMPTGIQPPVVVQYSASAVPILQISLSSDTPQ
jgi:multidrug efflux pump subunit AcrB